MKIAVYAIMKNEAHFVKKFCDSAKEADLVLIADTGSTDGAEQVARDCGATVYDICISPWRFDKARDAALALLPKDIDVCISLDIDEVLEPGWRQEIEKVWTGKVNRLRYKFDWSSGIVFYSEKIHARHGFHWHHPCHEYIRPDPRTEQVYATIDTLLVSHHPDPTKSRGSYLELLEVAVKEDTACVRNAFYYARELTFYSKWQEAIAALNKYLAMPEANWTNDRSYAMRLLGRCYTALNQNGMVWFRRACAELPNNREPWVALAQAAHDKGLWQECFFAASSAINIKEKQLVYTMDPEAWGARPHDLLAIAAYRLGLKEESIKHGSIALEFEPTNQRLITNLEFYKE